MSELPIFKRLESTPDTFNVFPVKALNQHNAAIFTLKALICLLLALMTFYPYIVLRFYTLPNFYEHNCTSTVHTSNTSEKNDFHIRL
jgi:hypothetical protein